MRNLLAGMLLAAATAGAAAAGQVLVAFGDSLTQGYGLAPEDGLVPQLQAWLRAHGHDVTVVNAGVSGDTTAGGLARIGWTLGSPADAIIVELGGNDVLRGIDPAASRANLDGILTAAAARGLPILLVGVPAPGNYGADYKQAFDAIYPELAAAHGADLVPDYFAPLTASGDRAQALAEDMQADGVHPNANGVKRIVAALGPRVEALLERAAR